MRIFSLYQLHMGQESAFAFEIRKKAASEAFFSLAIDTHFYPYCLYDSKRTRSEHRKFYFDYLISHSKWYLQHLKRGIIIIPLAFLCNIIDLLPRKALKRRYFEHSLLARMYQLDRSRVTSELFATYIRFLCSTEEEYGLQPCNQFFLSKLVLRSKIYHCALKLLFLLLRPSCYVTSQPVYLQGYLPCSVASDQNIPVHYLGLQGRLYKPNGQLIVDTCKGFVPQIVIRPSNYVDLYEGSSYSELRKKERIQAFEQLKLRVAGAQNDPLLFYMKAKPYAPQNVHIDAVNILSSSNISLMDLDRPLSISDNFVVVFMHDLNDHHFHSSVLPEFASSYYEWLQITLQLLINFSIPYVLKLHPCLTFDPANERSSAALQSLSLLSHKFKSPIPSLVNTTTTQLIELGMSLGLTVRGTVATELVMLQVPVICAGHPPYENFIPSRICTAFDEYQNHLIHFNKQPKISLDEFDSMSDYLALSLKKIL